MTEDELEQHVTHLRRHGSDDALVEATTAERKLPTDAWSSVSAFANTTDGSVVLGLSERAGFTPVEGFDVQGIIDQLDSGLDEHPGATPKVLPVPEHRIQRMELEGAPVVVVEVDSLRGVQEVEMPCHGVSLGTQKGSFKRVDDKNNRLTTYEVHLLRNAIRPVGVDREPVNGTSATDLYSDLVARILDRQRRVGSHALDGVSGSSQALERLNALTRIDAVHAVTRNLRTRRIIRGTSGQDVSEIPESALREAVTNAVAHRDYSDYVRGQQVSVDETLDQSHPLTAREVAERTGRTIGALRPILRTLVDDGLVIATAPPTSRRRACLRAPRRS